jgi:hypothetical protein
MENYLWREVSIGAGQGFGSRPIGLRVSVGQKIGIPGVRPGHGVRMPDRAKALFRSRRDFNDICEQAVGIGAINTAHLLDRVQVGQAPSIEDQIVSTPDLGNTEDREANRLIDGDGEIQQ